MDTPATEAAALQEGWRWLSDLPRAITAHADRGADPQAAVRGLLAELGDPQRRLRVIHIAGSKGKGSTALFAERLLVELGQHTFTFTSPHLEHWTERFRLDGGEAPARKAFEALAVTRAAAEARGIVPGFFEALTVAGLWLAEHEAVDWAVIECGVGGRADATTVVCPAATVITGIEREHVDRLGSELTAIAREKAGIVKPGAPLVAAALPPALEQVVAAAAARAEVAHLRARELGAAPATPAGPGEVVWHSDGDRLVAAGPGWHVRTRMAAPGRSAAGNATLALAAVATLGIASGDALQRAARVLARDGLPGRAEIVSSLPWVMVDSAHTAASAQALAATVTALAPADMHLLLSCSAGKDLDAVLAPLVPLARRVTVTCADPDHSVATATLAARVRAVRPGTAVATIADVEQALADATTRQPQGTLVLATGSVYLAGAVRACFR